jgi:hypothetical protein
MLSFIKGVKLHWNECTHSAVVLLYDYIWFPWPIPNRGLGVLVLVVEYPRGKRKQGKTLERM